MGKTRGGGVLSVSGRKFVRLEWIILLFSNSDMQEDATKRERAIPWRWRLNIIY
jgi:hypothetical protein